MAIHAPRSFHRWRSIDGFAELFVRLIGGSTATQVVTYDGALSDIQYPRGGLWWVLHKVPYADDPTEEIRALFPRPPEGQTHAGLILANSRQPPWGQLARRDTSIHALLVRLCAKDAPA